MAVISELMVREKGYAVGYWRDMLASLQGATDARSVKRRDKAELALNRVEREYREAQAALKAEQERPKWARRD